MKNDPTAVCSAIRKWAQLMTEAKREYSTDDAREFDDAWRTIHLGITKSCLLDRMIYGGEQPSQTKCPVHNGKWSGCFVMDRLRAPMSAAEARIREHPEWEGKSWHDVGCRCMLHTCGCATGWNPDEHCGCGVKP